MTKRETSLRLIELERRKAEIEQDTVQGRDSTIAGNVGKLSEVRMHRHQPVANARLLAHLGRTIDCDRVGVECENYPVWGRGLQQCSGVTTPTKGAVEILAPPSRPGLQGVDNLRKEHRPVSDCR